jgi:quinol monooxygenase YgiN
VVSLLVAATMFGAATRVQAQERVYVVTHIEAVPSRLDEVRQHLTAYRDAVRKAPGHVRVDALQELGRLDRFAVLSVWESRSAFEMHQASPERTSFGERLQPLTVAPLDERPHRGLVVGDPTTASARNAIFVLTHADALPPPARAVELLTLLGKETRTEAGSVRFEVLQQANRPNHFTLAEVWRSNAARQAHAVARHTREFRDGFGKITGSLYDERVYTSLN